MDIFLCLLIAGLSLLSGISVRFVDQSGGLVSGFKDCGGGESAVIDGPPVAQQQFRAAKDY